MIRVKENKEYRKAKVMIVKELIPDQQEIFSWILDLCKTPHRRTGTVEGEQAAKYIKIKFEEIGLSDVCVQRVDSANFDIDEYSLTVNGEDIPAFMINGTLHPHEFGDFTTGKECENAELIFLGEGRKADFDGVDVKGKIVVCECPWFEMDEKIYAETWCRDGGFMYDPDAEKREKLRKTDSYSPNAWPYNYIMAQKKGAVGFVGVLKDYFEDGINWSEDYSEIALSEGCKSFDIPGLWIGVTAFDKIRTHLDKKGAKATLKMHAVYMKGFAQNVYGMLPGESEKAILIHSHYDAVFNGAVQDASGMSEVLAIAKYFSQLPIEKRHFTMIFAGFDGHYTDYAGHKAFIKKLKDEKKEVLCDFVIEHIGKEVGLGDGNKPVIADVPEVRLLYVSKTGDLPEIVKENVIDHDAKRTIILPVDKYEVPKNGLYEFQQDEVISDAYYSHIGGIPIISMLSPQLYLFHPMDTPEMIPKEELGLIASLFVSIITDFIEVSKK